MVPGCHSYRNDILIIKLHNFLLKYIAIEEAVLIKTLLKNIAVWYLNFILLEMTSQEYRPKHAQSNVFFPKTYIKQQDLLL